MKTDLRIGKEMIFFGSQVNNPSFLLRPDLRGSQQYEIRPEKEHLD